VCEDDFQQLLEKYPALLSGGQSETESSRRRWLLIKRRRLSEIGGITLPTDAISKRPGIPIAMLADDERLERFLDVMDWCVAEFRSA
jgi:hypothetical protein